MLAEDQDAQPFFSFPSPDLSLLFTRKSGPNGLKDGAISQANHAILNKIHQR